MARLETRRINDENNQRNEGKTRQDGSAPAISAEQGSRRSHRSTAAHGCRAFHVCSASGASPRVLELTNVELAGYTLVAPCAKPRTPEASRHQIVAPTRFPRLPSACHLFSWPLQSSRPFPRPLHSLLCPSAALHLISSCLFGQLTTHLITHREISSARQSRRSACEKSPQHDRITSCINHLCIQRASAPAATCKHSASRACLSRQSPLPSSARRVGPCL